MSPPVLPQRRFRADQRAAVAIMFAVTATLTLSMATLAADIGFAYVTRAKLQQVADAAALAGAMAYKATGSATVMQATVQDVVVANGWASSTIQSASSEYVASSPANSAYHAVQVVLRATSPVSIGTWILGNTMTVQTKSVAQMGGGASGGGGAACLLALNSLTVNGTISATACGVAANGTSTIVLNSGGAINSLALLSGSANAPNAGGTYTGTFYPSTTVANPYASASASNPYGSCQTINGNSGTTLAPLSPGCYNLNSSVPVTLNDNNGSPGIYYFQNLNLNSGSSMTGTDVTVILPNGSSPNSNMTITAPTSGTYDGIAIFAQGAINFNSGVQWTLNGALYDPTATVTVDNGAFNSNACTYVVAQNIIMNSGGTVSLPQVNCSSFGGGAGFTHPVYGSSTVFVVQ